MEKLSCLICDKYRKFEKPNISYLLEKTLVLSIICSKRKNKDEKYFKMKRINWNIKNSWFNYWYRRVSENIK